MITEQQTLRTLLEQIARMETAEEIRQAGEQSRYFYEHATADEIAQLRDTFKRRNAELIELTRRESEESLRLLTANGFVLDTTEWLTIKRYAQKYRLSQ